MKFTFKLFAIMALLVLGAVSPARADIVVQIGVSNQGTSNVLLNDATDAAIVTGTVSGQTVNFESSGGLLSAEASGQAVITAGTGNDPFNDISFSLDSGDSFLKAVFNIDSLDDGDVMFTVEGININGGVFVDTFILDDNGQNFFNITAINLQAITKITLTGLAGLEFNSLKQVRIGGIGGNQVPEPASLALFATALGGLVARRRLARR